MTKEQEQARISALLEEKRGYELRLAGANESGDEEAIARAKAQVAGVEAELKNLGQGAKKPAARKSTRSAAK